MWPLDQIRQPRRSELQQLIRSLLAAQQETNGLLRELLVRQGATPRTPTAQMQPVTRADVLWPLTPQSPQSMFPPPRMRTRNDVSTTHEMPMMSEDLSHPPYHEPEPSDA